jgi:two-component system C4-dicarboxylate transport response regulator DctD
MPRAKDPERAVFVFDGNAAIRESLAATLRRSGFDVTTFEDADAFVAAAKASAPACIVVDAQTAGRPTVDILRELGGRAYTAPIVMISGRIDVESVVEMFKHGAVDVIEKPFHPATLVRRLREAIENWTRRRP